MFPSTILALLPFFVSALASPAPLLDPRTASLTCPMFSNTNDTESFTLLAVATDNSFRLPLILAETQPGAAILAAVNQNAGNFILVNGGLYSYPRPPGFISNAVMPNGLLSFNASGAGTAVSAYCEAFNTSPHGAEFPLTLGVGGDFSNFALCTGSIDDSPVSMIVYAPVAGTTDPYDASTCENVEVHFGLEKPYLCFYAPNLRTMYIDITAVSWKSLLATLRSAPLLKELGVGSGGVDRDIELPQDSSYVGSVGISSLECITLLDNLSPQMPEFFGCLLKSLSAAQGNLLVAMSRQWTDGLLMACLRHVLSHARPVGLYVHSQLGYYAQEESRPVSLLPELEPDTMSATFIARLSSQREWFLEALPRVGTRHQLSLITSLVLHTCIASSDRKVRALLCALPNVEICWIVDETMEENPVFRQIVACDTLIQALYPGPTVNDRIELPLPRLRTLGLGVSEDEPSRLLTAVGDVLRARRDSGMEALDGLSFALTDRPSDDDASAQRLLTLVSVVHWRS